MGWGGVGWGGVGWGDKLAGRELGGSPWDAPLLLAWLSVTTCHAKYHWTQCNLSKHIFSEILSMSGGWKVTKNELVCGVIFALGVINSVFVNLPRFPGILN